MPPLTIPECRIRLSLMPYRTHALPTILLSALALLLVWFAIPLLSAQEPSDAIGGPVVVTGYTNAGALTGAAMVEVPWTSDLPGFPSVTVYLDVNGDGRFSGNEVAVKRVASVAVSEFPTAYPVLLRPSQVLRFMERPGTLSAKVVMRDLSGFSDRLTKQVAVDRVTFEVSDFFTGTPPGFTGVSAAAGSWEPLRSLLPISTVRAQGPGTGGGNGVYNQNVPDLPGRQGHPNECFPVAAANSILWLAQKHNMTETLPATTDGLLDQIDQAVGYDPNSGTDDTNMISGKDAFARSTGLPLESQKIENTTDNGASTLFGNIEQALKEGKDVELIIKRKTSATGTSDLGHAVTVVGAYTKGKKKYIVVHDVLTRNGNDTYEVGRNGKVKGYSALSGDWYVEFIITESIR